MITFQEYFILNEAVSNIVWHFSKDPYNILKSNVFSLGSQIGPDVTKLGKPFYFSVARSKLGDYSKNPRGIIFKLDGDKFNRNYKGGPVDYWGRSGIKLRESDKSEMEDRIYSDSPTIPNARDYILEVIGWADEYSKKSVYSHYQKKVEDLAKSYGIPYKFYDSYGDFIANKNPHLSIMDVVDFNQIEEEPKPYKFSRKSKKNIIKNMLNYLINLKDPKNNYSGYDSNLRLSADYSNYLRRESDKSALYAKKLLSQVIKKLKLNNIDELINLRVKQDIQLKRFKNDLHHFKYKTDKYIKNQENNVSLNFDDAYDFSKHYLDNKFEDFSILYRRKDKVELIKFFKIFEDKINSKIQNILDTTQNINFNISSPKPPDESWKDVQI